MISLKLENTGIKMKSKSTKKKQVTNKSPFSQVCDKPTCGSRKTKVLSNLTTRQSNQEKSKLIHKEQSSPKGMKTPTQKISSLNSKRQSSHSQKKLKEKSLQKKTIPEEKGPSKGKLARERKLKAYFQAKIENLSQVDTTKSFYPISHAQPQPHSYLIQPELEPEKQKLCHLFASQQEITSQMFDINLVRNQRQCSSNDLPEKDISAQAQQLDLFSRNDWQALQTLKLKNEELNNYIQQLVQVQEKLRVQNQKLHSLIQMQHPREKQLLNDRIKQLNAQRNILSQNNANLQELLNQTKHQSDCTQNKCHQLEEMTKLSLQRQNVYLQECQSHLNQINVLSSQLRQSHRIIEELSRRNLEMEDHLRMCRDEKDKIRQNAVDLLQMLQQIQQDQV